MGAVLEGVRVVDFGRYVAGPYCASLLGDLGAEVIRVERVGGGEDRFIVPLAGDEGGAMFLQCNRNKQSLTVDPTTDRGREIVRRLVATADIVVVNLPPQALVSMGLDYESLSAIKPDIILTSINAFGSGGPWSDRLGFDGIAQVMSGLTYLTGRPGDPQKYFGPWVDFATASFAALGTVSALLWRRQTGEGQHVEASLLSTALTVASTSLVEQAATQINRSPTGNRSQTVGPADLFKTKDGWIIVQVASPSLYKRWALLMGEEMWLSDERFKNDESRGENGEALSERMSKWCEERTTAEALEILDRAKIPAGPLLKPQDVLDNEHVRSIGILQEIEYPGLEGSVPIVNLPLKLSVTPGVVHDAAPTIGQHTQEILTELGYDEEQIRSLRESRAV